MTTTTNTATEQYVDDVIDHYLDLVHINGTADDVLAAIDSGDSSEIVWELVETGNDDVETGAIEPLDDPDTANDLFRNALPTVRDRLRTLRWDTILLDRYHYANEFHPSGIEIPGCGSAHIVITDETVSGVNEFLVGFYDRSLEDDHLDLYRTFPTFGDLERALVEILRRNPEGTAWTAWAIQRIDDSDAFENGTVG